MPRLGAPLASIPHLSRIVRLRSVFLSVANVFADSLSLSLYFTDEQQMSVQQQEHRANFTLEQNTADR